ncbi:hypothetical protein ALC53_07112 [Atta colombica]|uniref:Uncharacterized protein n=1 Tax=Atta colombica TaxID=520822 RepID=A0A151I2Q2_9HYME|nr:hypothetical protein ALC53_07112 [Atta colombica]
MLCKYFFILFFFSNSFMHHESQYIQRTDQTSNFLNCISVKTLIKIWSTELLHGVIKITKRKRYLVELQAFAPFNQRDFVIIIDVTGIEEGRDAMFEGHQRRLNRKELVPRYSSVMWVAVQVAPLPNSCVRPASVLSHLRQNTYRHLSALAIVYDVDMLIVGTSAPGVTGVAEATRLVDLTVTAQGLIVVGADLATRIDLLVAELHANALSRALLQFSRRTLQTRPAPQCLSIHGSWSKRCCFDPTSFLPFSRMTSASSASSAISSASNMFMISSCTGASVVVVRRRYFRLR